MPSTIQLADLSERMPSLMYSARIDPTGSARMNSVSGECSAKYCERPVIVPDDPQPNTMASTRPSICSRISGPVVCLWAKRIVGVAELVDEVGARRFAGDPGGQVLVVVGVALGDVGAGQDDFGAHGLEVEDLLAAHLVRHDQNQPVSLLLGDQGKPDAGIASGALDQGVAGLDPAIALRGVDHAEADAVLDRAAGIVAFELEEQLAASGLEALGLDDRRIADQFEDALVNRHAGSAVVFCQPSNDTPAAALRRFARGTFLLRNWRPITKCR